MPRHLLLAATILAGLAAPALARDLGNGFSILGDVELEYTNVANDEDLSAGFADVTLGWRSDAGGAVGFGFDLTLVGFQQFNSGGSSQSVLQGGLVVTTGFGNLTVGSPRSVIKTLITPPEIGFSRGLGLELDFLGGSTTEFFKLIADDQFYGVSFIGSQAGFTYGAAYHQLDGTDVDSVELAARYEAGSTTFSGGYERFGSGPTKVTKLFLGAEYDAGRWSAGILASSADQGSGSDTILRLFGDYEVFDGLVLGAQYIDFEDGGSLYGIGAEYGFAGGAFANVGYVGSDQDFESLNASVGFRF